MYKENPVSLMNPPTDLLMRAGADYGPLVGNGQWWRFFSSGFVHFGALHLFLNMYCLATLGTQLESQIGMLKYVLIYFISMLTASMLSMYVHPFGASVGASGALFGLLGCELLLLLQLWKTLPKKQFAAALVNYLFIIILYIGVGAFFPIIDNFAHIGGLLGGIISACALLPLKPEKKLPNVLNLVSLTALGLLLWVCFNAVIQYDKQAADTMTAAQLTRVHKLKKDCPIPFWFPGRVGSPIEAIGAACLECPDYPTAIKMADKEVELDKQNAYAYYTRGFVQHKFHHDAEAIPDVDKALELAPNKYEFLALKARCELVLNQIKDAETDAELALKVDRKDHADAEDVLGCCILGQKKSGSINHFNKAISENGELGSAFYHRAMAHQLLGDKMKAEQDFIRAQDHSYLPDAWDKEHTTRTK
jgi:rhomboid protease GluP